jgi:hypothetical protein
MVISHLSHFESCGARKQKLFRWTTELIVDVAPIARWGSVALPKEGVGCHSCAGDKNPPDAQWLTCIRKAYAFVVEGQRWQQPISKKRTL